MDQEELYHTYHSAVCGLETLCPASKLEDLKNIKKILEKFKPNEVITAQETVKPEVMPKEEEK
jgi:hypothetical protein